MGPNVLLDRHRLPARPRLAKVMPQKDRQRAPRVREVARLLGKQPTMGKEHLKLKDKMGKKPARQRRRRLFRNPRRLQRPNQQ